MYYTEIEKMKIIHPDPPEQYSFEGDGLFTYWDYIEVEVRPTLEQAELVYGLCVGGNLSAGRGETVELTKCPSVKD